MSGSEPPVTPDDQSQLPVEHLAQVLLRLARDDTALARRPAANDDDMQSRLDALPVMQREPEPMLSLPPRLGDAAGMEALEELVSVAIGVARDAEDLSHEAYEASRWARRGVIAGVALGLLGIAVAAAGVLGGPLTGGTDSHVAELGGQMQALSAMQHRISDQLAALQAQPAVPRSSGRIAAAQAPMPTAAPTLLPPLATKQVGVLPAHVAVDGGAAAERSNAAFVSPAPAGSYYDAARAGMAEPVNAGVAYSAGTGVAESPPHRDAAPAPWRAAPRPEPVYRSQIVMPWPAVYVIGTLRREVRVLFR